MHAEPEDPKTQSQDATPEQIGVESDPMPGTLLAKLFGVPLLIISVIVGCAVVVVLLFGSITTDRERPISTLLDVLEGNLGEKTAGLLLPAEKEVWQVSRELALRLQNKDAELSADEVETVADRLAAILDRSSDGGEMSKMGSMRLHFIMHALALTGSEKAVEPIAGMLEHADAETRREALSALADLRESPRIRAVIPRILKCLQDENSVVRTVACVSITSIATPADERVVEALGRAYFDADREVRWNATLALARMGSLKGKSLLLDMLERRFWEEDVKVRIEAAAGVFNEYPMPAGAVDRYLSAAVEAGAHLSDAEVWQEIATLADDSAPMVKNAALKAIESRDPQS